MRRYILTIAWFTCLVALARPAASQIPQKLSVQAILQEDGVPVDNPSATLTFRLWTDATSSDADDVVWSETQTALAVKDGLVTVLLGASQPLDAGLFSQPLWLGVAVGSEDAKELEPRIELTAAPYALSVAGDKASVESINNLTGAVGIRGEGGASVTIQGNDIVITAADGSGSSWSTTGNSGTAAGSDFIGTTDDQPLVVKVAGETVLRFEPRTHPSRGFSGNIVGGYATNRTGESTFAAFIGGGGAEGFENEVTADYGAIAGGRRNTVSGSQAFVGGGDGNVAGGIQATVAGGFANRATGQKATVGGGAGNLARGFASTIAGGASNVAGGDFSFAAGRRAGVRWANLTGDDDGDEGTFVWADSREESFMSTGPDQFLVRAAGGVGINTRTPQTALAINAGLGGTDVGITQGLVGGTNTLELTTADGSGNQATRLLFRGATDNAGTEFLYGPAGSETLSLFIHGNSGNVGIGIRNPPSPLTVPGIIESQAGGFKFPDGTVQTTAAAGGGTDASAWKVGGNAGTTAGTDFIGTTDQTALEIKVDGNRVMRYEPPASPASDAPNIIAGWSGNGVNAGVVGATIAGGGLPDFSGSPSPNVVEASYGTVGGGWDNAASGAYAVVSGGGRNRGTGTGAAIGGGEGNAATGSRSTVSGGDGNAASGDVAAVNGGSENTASGPYSVIGGGSGNVASGRYGTISGGGNDDAGAANRVFDEYGTVGGGTDNRAGSDDGNLLNSPYATVAGGGGNRASARQATVGGGGSNQALAECATVVGGVQNAATGDCGTVLGGSFNKAAGDHSVAAGGSAHANHDFSFVWNDEQIHTPLATTAPYQFVIGASGGVIVEGNVEPRSDNLWSMGRSGKRWTSVWSTDGSINTSDRRAKRDVETLVYGLEEIRRLRPVTYLWRDRPEDGRRLGLIAQEVEAVVPEVVRHGGGLLGMSYEGLVPVLIKAVQEQQVRIETLEETMDALRAHVERLEAAR